MSYVHSAACASPKSGMKENKKNNSTWYKNLMQGRDTEGPVLLNPPGIAVVAATVSLYSCSS